MADMYSYVIFSCYVKKVYSVAANFVLKFCCEMSLLSIQTYAKRGSLKILSRLMTIIKYGST